MATRRDRTNQFGYVCPTENQAIWNADHPKKTERTRVLSEDQIKRQGIQKTEARKQLDSFSAFLDTKAEPDRKLKRMRNVYITIAHVCSLAGVKIDSLSFHFIGEEKIFTEEELRN
ncbi:MAG: hypothetical protein IJJ80_08635 [Clostridia bacterium]|nr:hypothetical protein [Clostridia bacterium]